MDKVSPCGGGAEGQPGGGPRGDEKQDTKNISGMNAAVSDEVVDWAGEMKAKMPATTARGPTCTSGERASAGGRRVMKERDMSRRCASGLFRSRIPAMAMAAKT